MPDIFRDQVWQFVGVLVAVVVALLSFVGYLRGRRIKKLAYYVVSQHPLFTVNTLIRQKVQVLYDGKPVQDLQLLAVRIANTGTVPITAQDVERPVAVVLNPEAQILLADISEPKPPNLGATITQDAARVVLQPILLNPGDAVSIWILATGLKKWQIDGRIVGVKTIEQFRASGWSLLVPLFYLGVFLALIAAANATAASLPIVSFILLILTIVWTVFTFVAAARDKPKQP